MMTSLAAGKTAPAPKGQCRWSQRHQRALSPAGNRVSFHGSGGCRRKASTPSMIWRTGCRQFSEEDMTGTPAGAGTRSGCGEENRQRRHERRHESVQSLSNSTGNWATAEQKQHGKRDSHASRRFEQLTAYRELVRSLQVSESRRLVYRCVADPQSASADGAVPGKCTGAVVTTEEAEARRLCDDINAMLMKRRQWDVSGKGSGADAGRGHHHPPMNTPVR